MFLQSRLQSPLGPGFYTGLLSWGGGGHNVRAYFFLFGGARSPRENLNLTASDEESLAGSEILNYRYFEYVTKQLRVSS